MRTLKDILNDFTADRIPMARAREEIMALGASEAEADETIAIALGESDVIEVSEDQAAALAAEEEETT